MSRIDDVSRPVPATVQSKAPGGRRSFSSFRSSIPSSLSLPQLSLQHRPSLSVHPGRQSGSDDDGSFITGHSEFNLPSAQSSNASSNTLPTNIRSLRSRFSFGSSSPSLSNPKTSSGTLMSKFSLGPSRSGKPKVTSYPGSNDAMEAGETSDMVLTIDALSLSPQHSDPSPEPTLSEGLSGPSSNLYPSLGRGLPRTSSPLVSIRPTSSLALPPPDTQFPSSQSHSESDTLADSGLLSPKPTPRITSRRVSGSVGISYSRISEHTEPDTSLEVSKVTPIFRNQGKSSIGLDTNPGDASEDSTFGQELNSEDQVSKALVDIASSESLTNLNIPPIPKSGSILSLDRTLDQTLPDASPLVASDAVPGNGNEISATPDEREGGSILVTSSESSDHHMDADLATILSPHQYDSRGTREPDRQDDPARSAGSARRDLTMVLSSTPAKKNTARRNSKAFTLGSGGSNVSPLSAEHSPIRNGDIDGEQATCCICFYSGSVPFFSITFSHLPSQTSAIYQQTSRAPKRSAPSS
ncbi:hypothetical protein BS47DRAFT_413051 [Hydnum rufescens UP504]|uniref:Uncharacterized protein n=1 Tax=Hydnum rufescens UP504 TaxID=1448309 RepID=A0A9P6BB62_9AGAM|nr:hypothetical protein BS47DRAFT_413051 [Hydnum rufescens UP504]